MGMGADSRGAGVVRGFSPGLSLGVLRASQTAFCPKKGCSSLLVHHRLPEERRAWGLRLCSQAGQL